MAKEMGNDMRYIMGFSPQSLNISIYYIANKAKTFFCFLWIFDHLLVICIDTSNHFFKKLLVADPKMKRNTNLKLHYVYHENA